jgi:hypothetical protein
MRQRPQYQRAALSPIVDGMDLGSSVAEFDEVGLTNSDQTPVDFLRTRVLRQVAIAAVSPFLLLDGHPQRPSRAGVATSGAGRFTGYSTIPGVDAHRR